MCSVAANGDTAGGVTLAAWQRDCADTVRGLLERVEALERQGAVARKLADHIADPERLRQDRWHDVYLAAIEPVVQDYDEPDSDFLERVEHAHRCAVAQADRAHGPLKPMVPEQDTLPPRAADHIAKARAEERERLKRDPRTQAQLDAIGGLPCTCGPGVKCAVHGPFTSEEVEQAATPAMRDWARSRPPNTAHPSDFEHPGFGTCVHCNGPMDDGQHSSRAVGGFTVVRCPKISRVFKDCPTAGCTLYVNHSGECRV